MSPQFLIPFILLWLCFDWNNSVKTACIKRYDSVLYYTSPLYNISVVILALCIVVGLIIGWVGAGFLAFLGFIGIGLLTLFLGQLMFVPLLITIFGYQGIGAILPPLCGIISAIWMISQSGSLYC